MKVFLDCMIYLHYRHIEELDLPSLLNTNRVTIVIPPITLHELDKQKNMHKSRKVSNRARSILKKIEQWYSGEPSLKKDISFEFPPDVPKIDYQKYGLDPQWSDHALIASIFEYRMKYSNEQIVLITQDTGPRLKAQQLGIEVRELPEEMKLPDELDPIEIENRELKKELGKYQNAMPKLTVCFAGSNDHRCFSLTKSPENMDNVIACKIDDLRRKFPKLYQSPSDSFTLLTEHSPDMNIFDSIMPREYNKYNSDVDKYLSAYKQYMYKKWNYDEYLRLTISFKIEIRNTGSIPAEDVDVEIHFPEGFILMTEDNLPALPKAPLPPQKPGSQSNKIISNSISDFKRLLNSTRPTRYPIPNIFNMFGIKRKDSYTLVTDHFTRIKHGASVKLQEIYLKFDSYESARAFHCDYIIRPGNIPEPIEGKLHFKIEEKGQ